MAKWLVTCHLGIYKHTRELQNPFFTWNTALYKNQRENHQFSNENSNITHSVPYSIYRVNTSLYHLVP